MTLTGLWAFPYLVEGQGLAPRTAAALLRRRGAASSASRAPALGHARGAAARSGAGALTSGVGR